MFLRWKTPVSIFLLGVFVFNTCLFGVVFASLLFLHKEQERTALKKPAKEIMELRIDEALVEHHNSEFEWENNWEFKFHDEMYDVVESHKEGGTWVFACKHDTKEEILKNRAARETKRNQQDRESQAKKNIKVGNNFLADNGVTFNFSTSVILPTVNNSTDLTAVFHAVPHPPPWFI